MMSHFAKIGGFERRLFKHCLPQKLKEMAARSALPWTG